MATQAATTARVHVRAKSLYYPVVAVGVSVAIFLGFSRSYYLAPLFHTPPLGMVFHIHGAVMTLWMVLLLTQVFLVAAHRTDIHRKLGLWSGIVALGVVVVGVAAGIHAAQLGHAPPGLEPLRFLVVPLGDAVAFAGLVGAAFYYRKRPDIHRRLMLVLMLELLPPGIARWPGPMMAALGPLWFYGVPDLLMIAALVYDYRKTRKINRAMVVAVGLVIASHPLRLMLASTGAWMAFAHSVTGS